MGTPEVSQRRKELISNYDVVVIASESEAIQTLRRYLWIAASLRSSQ
jgi:hypothetical protein